MRVEEIARVAHEVNRAYCTAIGEQPPQPAWSEAPSWQKESAIAGVTAQLDNPTLTPEQSHANWFEHKRAEGWRFGEVKDPAKKEHPCMVPYSQLPLAQRVKDYLFGAVVRALT